MNRIISRAASCCFDAEITPTLDPHGLFIEPGRGPTYSVPGTPTMMFTDGSRFPGAVSAEKIEEKLNAIAKR